MSDELKELEELKFIKYYSPEGYVYEKNGDFIDVVILPEGVSINDDYKLIKNTKENE